MTASGFKRYPDPGSVKDVDGLKKYLADLVRTLEQERNQQIRSRPTLANLPVHADTSAAVAAGLRENELFVDSSGVVHVVKVV